MAKKIAKAPRPQVMHRMTRAVAWLAAALSGALVFLDALDRFSRLATRYDIGTQAMVALFGAVLVTAAVVILFKALRIPFFTRLDLLRGSVQFLAIVVALVLLFAGTLLLLPASTRHVFRFWMFGPQVDLTARRSFGTPPAPVEDTFVANPAVVLLRL